MSVLYIILHYIIYCTLEIQTRTGPLPTVSSPYRETNNISQKYNFLIERWTATVLRASVLSIGGVILVSFSIDGADNATRPYLPRCWYLQLLGVPPN